MAAISGTGPFGAFTLKVTPEDLKGKAQEISTQISSMRSSLDSMLSLAAKTVQYWTGDAADVHRELFESVRPLMEDVLNRYTEHNASLEQIADRYIETENQIVQDSESLPVSPL